MPKRKIQINRDGILLASYTPPSSENFSAFSVKIPNIIDDEAERNFREHTGDLVRSACGLGAGACGSCTYIETVSGVPNYVRSVINMSFSCNTEDCPLYGEGGSGDREPRVPIGPHLDAAVHAEPFEVPIELG